MFTIHAHSCNRDRDQPTPQKCVVSSNLRYNWHQSILSSSGYFFLAVMKEVKVRSKVCGILKHTWSETIKWPFTFWIFQICTKGRMKWKYLLNKQKTCKTCSICWLCRNAYSFYPSTSSNNFAFIELFVHQLIFCFSEPRDNNAWKHLAAYCCHKCLGYNVLATIASWCESVSLVLYLIFRGMSSCEFLLCVIVTY